MTFFGITSTLLSQSLSLFVCIFLCLMCVFLKRFVPSINMETVYLLAWDSFLVAYLLLALRMFITTNSEDIKKRVHEQYERKRIMLILILITSFISMIAIINEMRISAQYEGWLFHLTSLHHFWYAHCLMVVYPYFICLVLCPWLL